MVAVYSRGHEQKFFGKEDNASLTATVPTGRLAKSAALDREIAPVWMVRTCVQRSRGIRRGPGGMPQELHNIGCDLAAPVVGKAERGTETSKSHFLYWARPPRSQLPLSSAGISLAAYRCSLEIKKLRKPGTENFRPTSFGYWAHVAILLAVATLPIESRVANMDYRALVADPENKWRCNQS